MTEGAAPDAPSLRARGNAALAEGRMDEAERCYRDAVAADPGDPLGRVNLAYVLLQASRIDEAQQLLEGALALRKPGDSFVHDAYFLLAQVHLARGASGSALVSLDAALAAHPNFAEALEAKARVLSGMHRHDESIATARRLQLLGPNPVGALVEAFGQWRLGRMDEALDSARRALQLSPEQNDWGLLAAVHGDAGFAQDALEFSRRAVAAGPGDLHARSRELFFGNFDENADPQALFNRHAEYGKLLEESVAPVFREGWKGTKESGRRLRIGIVSPDLSHHPVGMFLQPLLERLDRTSYEAWCYSGVTKPDASTAALRAQCTGWADAAQLTDDDLAARIQADGIDVLLDLAGHSSQPRLGVFARQPAPVQMTWLGYLNTTGLTRIGWRLCDERTDPAVTQRWHTETLLPFGPSQWCYRPFVDKPFVPQAPCASNGHVTFGSFNNARKIGDAMCERWAQLMQRCPGSRMLIADISTQAKRRAITAAFAREGVGADRLTFAPRADLETYYGLFGRVDIALDSFPYGGGTTTLDALWMGVPVFTMKGALPVSRSASAILELLDMHDWVAHAPHEFVEKAALRAHDHQRIGALRTQLRAALKASPLMDEAGFARAFEQAVRKAWQAHLDCNPNG